MLTVVTIGLSKQMVLSRRLERVSKLLALRILQGSLLHSLGAAKVNERSPKVARLLKVGYFSNNAFTQDLRLYLGTGLGCKSSDIYKGASPLRALKTKRKISNCIL